MAKKVSIWEIKGDIFVSSEICRMKGNDYQYARPNDKLPSVKRAFLQANRENAFAALILIEEKSKFIFVKS